MSEKGEAKRRVVGYAKDGRAHTFELAPGEKLPDGYQDFPPAGHHPHDKDGTNSEADQAERSVPRQAHTGHGGERDPNAKQQGGQQGQQGSPQQGGAGQQAKK